MAYLKAADFETRMAALAAANPLLCTVAQFPNQLHPDGGTAHSYSFLKIGKGGAGSRPTALVVGGVHAREWAQPDALIILAERLIAAYKGSTSGSTALTVPAYGSAGGYSVPVADVKRLVEAIDIFLVPLANPDGRAFSEGSDTVGPLTPAERAYRIAWRKNRAARVVAANRDTVGVDLNRHFDIAWDINRVYSAAAISAGRVGATTDPTDLEIYNGAQSGGVASQPEVRNLVWLLENQPITYVIDCHSAKGLVMYPWAIEQNGDVADQNIWNVNFDGQRDAVPNPPSSTTYREFSPTASPELLRNRHQVIAASIKDAIVAATGRTYQVGGVADILYVAPGSLTDFAFSRHLHVAGVPPVYSIAMEFGFQVPLEFFQPDPVDPDGYALVEREIHAAVLAFLRTALPTGPATSPGSSSCSLTIAVIGIASGVAWLDDIRALRTAATQRRSTRVIVAAVDRIYRPLSRLVAPALLRSRRLRRLVALGVVRPLAAMSTWMLGGRVS